MSLVNKIIGEINYTFKGQNCQKDIEAGMSDRDLIKKYGDYVVSKVKESLTK
jgi:hypothetical protein